MSRKKAVTVIDVNQHRAENYASHFQCRQRALVDPNREEISKLVAHLPKPTLNIYGVPAFEGKVMWPTTSHYFQSYFELHKKLGFELDLEYWYWSDAGWAEFEKQWQELPEVIHMELCTNGKVIHISTQETYSNATEPG